MENNHPSLMVIGTVLPLLGFALSHHGEVKEWIQWLSLVIGVLVGLVAMINGTPKAFDKICKLWNMITGRNKRRRYGPRTGR